MSPAKGLILQPVHLTWIKGLADDPHDLCAHGRVDFRIDDDILVDPEKGPKVTVSAAALFLLRTLSRSHTLNTPVGDHLFPHCGHSMFKTPESDDVLLMGCNGGLDFEVVHEPGGVVRIRAPDGRSWVITAPAWKEAVFRFADGVSKFYAASSLKHPSPPDAAGFRAFASEWKRRRGRDFGHTVGVV